MRINKVHLVAVQGFQVPTLILLIPQSRSGLQCPNRAYRYMYMYMYYMVHVSTHVLRTFGSVEFSLVFICGQSVSEFLSDGLPASFQFPVMPKHAQYMYAPFVFAIRGETTLCTHAY